MSQKKKYISQSEFAKSIGISQPAVHKLIKAGKIPMENGKVIIPDAIHAYSNLKESHNVTTDDTLKKSNAGQIHQQAKAAYQSCMAQIKKLELDKLRGELIPVSEAVAEFQMVATLIRSDLLSLPSRYAGLLEGQSISKIESILSEAVNDCLTKFHNTKFDQSDDLEIN